MQGTQQEGDALMYRFKIRAAALALLAGSALSGAAMAQDQGQTGGGAAEQGTGAPVLPQSSASGGAQVEGGVSAQGGTPQSDNTNTATTPDATMPNASEQQASPARPTDEEEQSDTDTAAQPQSGSNSDAAGTAGADADSSEAETQADTNDATSGEATSNVDISVEQKTEIRNIFVEQTVEPADISVEVNVGTAIPKSVTLHPLPSRIIEIVPAYRGYEYFVLADGRIIIVKPATYEVVYILT
jgi:hypothetical protein